MSFPRYPKYKDSGVEWLGEVPEHWEIGPIKRHISKVESRTSVNAADEPAENGKLGVLKTSCVYTGVFQPEENKTVVDDDLTRVSCPLRANTIIVSRMNTPELIGAAGWVETAPGNLFLPDRLWQISFANSHVKYVSESDCEEFDRRVVPQIGDVLYTKGGTTGIARVVDLEGRFQVWVHIAVLKVKQDMVDSHFLAFALNSVGCYEQSQLLTRGATNNDLGLTRTMKIWFVLPPIEEQRQVVAFLRSETKMIDALSAEAQKAIDLLQERRTALISAAVTGQIDVRKLAAA